MTSLTTAGLVFTRIASLFATLPVVSATGVPKAVPVLLALATTALILPTVGTFSSGSSLVMAMLGEVVLGAVAGLTVRAVFASLALAGELIGMQMGFAMAQMFDPVQRTSQSPVAMLSTMMAVAMFLQLNLHGTSLILLVDSFQAVPVGEFVILNLETAPFIDATGNIFRFGMQLSGPVIVLVLLINVLIGILGKLAPRMNVFFSIGPILTTGGGIALLAESLPSMLVAHSSMMKASMRSFAHVLGM